MTNKEILKLIDKYKGEYFPSKDFEHRVDEESENITYALVREYKPTSVLEIGTWNGGITCLIMSALIKNKQPFRYEASELLPDKAQTTLLNVLKACRETPGMTGDITKNLKRVPKELDLLFLDSDHDAKTTNWIIKNIFPRIKKEGLFFLHDWAVREAEDGSWFGKGNNGSGGWPETQIFIDMHKKGEFPFEKVYWNYLNPNRWELGVFRKK